MTIRFYRLTLLLSLTVFIIRCQESSENNNQISNNPPTTSSEWEQVWADEFDGDELDLSKWNILRWRPGWVNNEQQAYTCLLYTSPSPRDATLSRMPSSA